MSTDPSAAGARGSMPKRLLWIAGVCAASIVLFEATLRVIAYSGISWGGRIRIPQRFADRWSDPFYFQLSQRFTGLPGDLPQDIRDPRLGWVNEGMDREHFVDPREARLGDRRPVLLFGDSYVRCMSGEENCFEGWMERSPAGATHAIVNYGVRGYGIDQIAMLARLVLERWRGQNPLVVIGIFMEDDLDRAILDYRGWPKPRFTFDSEGGLVEPGPVPTPEQYAEDHPLWTRSLAWGWLIHGSGWLPSKVQSRLAGTERRIEEKKRLGNAILGRLERDLEQAGVERFYALFPSLRQCRASETLDWQEQFLIDWLDARRLPYVNLKREILLAALEQRRHPSEYFGIRGPLAEHLTPSGTEVAFRGLLRGIEGDYDRFSGRQPPHPGEFRNLEQADETRLRFEFGWSQRFPDEADRERVVMIPDAQRHVRIGCIFSRPARRFMATAKLLSIEGELASAPLRLEIRVNKLQADEKLALDLVLDTSKPSEEFVIDLFNRTNIEIVATRPDAANASGNVLVLSMPRFD